MLKIKKITIENFRGIKQPFTLEFKKGDKFTSALLFGRNGTGKSSIIDAWEWFNNFKIASLSKEGILTSDFPHKSSKGENCYVSVEFHHASINSAKVQFDQIKTSSPKTSGDYNQFKTYCNYPNYLRYADIQEFVFKTKTEKYKYIAKFFGLEEFIKN